MGRRGPPPKPTKLKVAAGNPGRHRLNEREPQPDVAEPPMPEWLPRAAKAEWRRIVPELLALKVLARIDQQALVGYCLAVHEMEEATRTVEREGRVCRMPIENKAGDVIGERLKSHPAVQQQRDAMQRVKAFVTEFGLTPASRSRVQMAEAGDDDGRRGKFFGTVG